MVEPGTIIEVLFYRDENVRCVVIPKRYPICADQDNLRVVLLDKGADPRLMVGRIFYVSALLFLWECTESTAIKLLKRAVMDGDMSWLEKANFLALIDES